MDFGGKNIVYFVVEEVSALLAQGNELPYLVIFFFNGQRQEILPRSTSFAARECAVRRTPQITYRRHPNTPGHKIRDSS
jgi:hypothetical protein